MSALEARVADADSRLAEADSRLSSMETQTTRMLREQARALSWIVEAQQRQSVAIAAIATAAGVQVDLTNPPLLPQAPQ